MSICGGRIAQRFMKSLSDRFDNVFSYSKWKLDTLVAKEMANFKFNYFECQVILTWFYIFHLCRSKKYVFKCLMYPNIVYDYHLKQSKMIHNFFKSSYLIPKNIHINDVMDVLKNGI